MTRPGGSRADSDAGAGSPGPVRRACRVLEHVVQNVGVRSTAALAQSRDTVRDHHPSGLGVRGQHSVFGARLERPYVRANDDRQVLVGLRIPEPSQSRR